MLTNVEYVYLFTPLITGYLSTILCKMDKNSGVNVKFRPPSWVFSIVWPILYILLGISWLQSTRVNKKYIWLYLSLVLSLVFWIFTYSCKKDKKLSVYILLISIVVCLMCFSVGNEISKLCISPLLGWLIFALLMNTQEIQQ
jgi:translocator protein